jgi:hypothetical protein
MIKSRRMRWAGNVARMGEKRNAFRTVVGKTEGKRPLGRPRRSWVDNIKNDISQSIYYTHYGLHHTYLWSWALLEEEPFLQLLKNSQACYGTRRSITVFTGPYPEPDQSNPSHPISVRSILILSTQLRLGLPSGLFPSGFPTNILQAFLLFPLHATCPAHIILTWSF